MELKLYRLKNNLMGIGGNILIALEILYYKRSNELIYFDFENMLYSNSGNIWNKYFYQPYAEYEDLIKSKIKKKEYSIEYYKPNINYRYTYLGKNLKYVYDKSFVDKLRNIFKKNIFFKKELINKVNLYENKYLIKKNIIVQLRGTDRFQMHAKGLRHQFTNSEFINKVQKTVFDYKIDNIFLATDDYSYYLSMKKNFHEILLPSNSIPENYENLKFSEEQHLGHNLNIFESEKFKNLNAEQAIIDCILMSRCSHSLFSKSNLALVSIMLKDNYNFSFLDEHIYHE